MKVVWLLVAAAVLIGCPSRTPSGGETSSSRAPKEEAGSAVVASSSPRKIPKPSLPPKTTFRTLLDALTSSKASASCLFRGASLGVSRRNVEGAKTSLVRFSEVAGSPSFSIGLWTPHGTTRQVTREAFDHGVHQAPVDHWLATVTPASVGLMQQQVVVVLWITADAIWFSGIVASGVVGETWTKLAGADLSQFHTLSSKMSGVVLTADPDVSVARVREALTMTRTSSMEVALAVAATAPPSGHDDGVVDHVVTLPRGTPGVCRTGIGDIPAGLKSGSGFAVMKRADDFDAKTAKACASKVPKDSAGGRIHVAMRVMKDGQVNEACVSKDPIGDQGLRQCIVSQTKAYRFPKITDGDFQNVGLGVEIAPPGGVVTGVCGE